MGKAETAFHVMASRLRKAHPEQWSDIQKRGRRITLVPANQALLIDRSAVVQFMALLMGVVGIVLLLACVNVANLLLARSAARTREVSIRLSLGAGRLRLIRQFLTESLLLSLASGMTGVLLAFWATRFLMGFRPPLPLPVELDLSLDMRVLGFALAASLVTGLAFGLLPAIRATRPDLNSALKEASPEAIGRGVRILSLRNSLTVAQVALSLLLLVGAGLFVRSLLTATAIEVGFESRNMILASLDLGLQGYDEARGLAFCRQLLERLDSLPGARASTLADQVPLGFDGQRTLVEIEGYTPREGEDMELNFNVVAPRYFETMRIPLMSGREFTAQDRAGAPGVVIVNEALARRYWPGLNPLGKRIRRGQSDFTVVGLARGGKYRSLSEEPLPFLYLPLFQHYRGLLTLQLSAHQEPNAIVGAVRHEVQTLDKDLPLFNITTMEDHLGVALLPSRAAATLLGSFGALALLLALVGIYGVTSYAVSRRTRELGIRMALGAGTTDILRMILGQGMIVLAIGLVIGLGAALGLTRFASSLLYGVSATDPWTIAGVSLLLAVAALAATLVPAVRAARIHPTEALRYE